MWRGTAILTYWLFCLLAASPPALAEKRVALVVGNSAYKHTSPLANPVNDAEDMAAALKALGFQVTKGTDLDKQALDRMVSAFASTLKGAKLALFFYAGHGLQVAGQNYLVPVDAKLESSSALDFEAVRLDLIQRTMERETDTNVLFLDACRDNPLTRNLARSMGTRSTDIGRGLAVQESGSGTLISFSTQPGNVALDGAGRNSPFAAALTKHLTTASEDLSAILINVRNDVMEATANRQVPWEHSALRARLYFSPPPPQTTGPQPQTPGPPQTGAVPPQTTPPPRTGGPQPQNGGPQVATGVVTVLLAVDIYTAPGGSDLDNTGKFLAAGTQGVTIVENKDPWFHVKWPGGQGWVYSGEGHVSLQLP